MIQQRGVTLIDVLVALVVTAVSIMAFFQLFAFGAIQIERLGYRREAMALLKGEMEFWRARFQSASLAHPVKGTEAQSRKRSLVGGSGLPFLIEPTVESPVQDKDLKFQRLQVRVTYARVDLVDTVEMETRQYVW
jgi:type II secretory pathway component PulK